MRQKALVKRLAENQGNVSKSMREVGYSKVTAKTPQNVTESQGFKELMQEYLPDDLVLKRHREHLESKKVVRIYGKNGTIAKEIVEESPVSSRAIDMAHKLKGNYAPEKKEISGALSLSELFGEE